MKTSLLRTNSGQTLVEFSLCLLWILPLLVGSYGWLRDAWLRSRCIYAVFDQTHAQLMSTRTRVKTVSVDIQEDESAVWGQAICGGTLEKVQMKKLETQ